MNKKALWLLLTLFLSLRIMAQGEDFTILKGDCMPLADESTADGHRATHRALIPKTDWDREKIYKQMVILFTFSGDDSEFKMENPQEYYQKLFNEKGFNPNLGPGCVADYFRDQSGGLCNIEFDIYGPVQVSSKSQPYDKPDKNTHNYGKDSMKEATQLVLEANPDVDYSQYDWNDDGTIEQVIYIHAGPPGNTDNAFGHIWPNTSSFNVVTTPDGKKISSYSASGEYWGIRKADNVVVYCGIGTVCHEYSHSLGLPDIYPTTADQGYSVCDEWDLMDGGNFTNWGWCPPNYTALEKYLMGWLELTELNEAATITGMKPVSEGGTAYIVKHSDSEWLLLENRQQTAWDAGAPGKGLVIYHVNYVASSWSGNSVNNKPNARNFHLIAADNRDYNEWDDFLIESGAKSQYANSERMNNLHLSGAPYPLANDEGILNDALTDTSVPAAVVYNKNAEDTLFMSKPITDIVQNEDGTVSFKFMNGTLDVIDDLVSGLATKGEGNIYDLQGRRIYGKPARGLVIKDNRKMIIR